MAMARKVQQDTAAAALSDDVNGAALSTLGVITPPIPGDVSLSGALEPEIVSSLAERYRSWITLNKADSPDWHPDLIEAAGCIAEVTSCPGPAASEEQVDAVCEALERLPRPLMMQCNTGTRVGAGLLLWLARRGGHSAEAAGQLGRDLGLSIMTNVECPKRKLVREWVLGRLPSHDALAPTVSDNGLIFQQLFDDSTSTYTYLLGSSVTKEAVLIDPVLEQRDRDLAAVCALGLNLKFVVNTHCHADHVTSGGVIRQTLPSVQTVISAASGAKADIHVVEGDALTFGKFSLRAIATPGHTDGCITWSLEGDRPRIFTGDTLLIRGCGRTDFQQGNAEVLYDSVWQKLFTMKGETLVYPGHDYKGRNVSSIDEERLFNSRLTKSKEDFVKLMSELNLPYPKRIDVAVPANMVCGLQD